MECAKVSVASISDSAPRTAQLSAPRPNIFRQYCNVIFALMMHDIKNRFFGSGLGQIVLVFWPFAHILIMIIIYVVTRRPNPYGESLIQYTAISIYPFICFTYVSRWIVFSAATNRAFLQYPIVKPLDLLIARAFLEFVSISLVAIMLIVFVMVMGYNAMPVAPAQAIYAFGALVFLSIGMGFFNGVIALCLPLWPLIYTGVVILAYISSGALFVASNMPEPLRTYLSYNPLLNCTEWFRSVYYSDYPTLVLDRQYVLEFALVTFTLAFVLYRLLRRFM